jgi:TPR repeat protein
MLRKIIFTILFVTSFNSLAQAPLDPNYAFRKERLGLKQFNNGNYNEAFSNLSELAAWGFKDSQYALAFMFLKGQHVKQSTLIGLSWLALAAESGRKDWINQFNVFYSAASKKEQLKIDKMIKDYKSKFGMKVQRVTCSTTQNLGSLKSVRKCIKGDYYVHKYEIDLIEPVL